LASANQHIKKKLDERRASGAYRTLKPENNLVDFCSNDYLGFAHSIELKSNTNKEIAGYNTLNGSAGSRLISGNLAYTEQLEQQIATYHSCESGLIYNSGYDANVGLFSSLPQRGDTIITDELIHASIIDGARLSHANRYTFKHNDLNSLEAKLQQAKGICYVAIESIYSMDGDTPPILDILNLTEKYNAHLIVDEAHAVGLYKQGLINHINLQDRIFARVVTFGKALGCHGAVVLGSNLLREYLINFSRSFIYTTAAPFHQLASVKMAYELLKQSDDDINQLKANISLFKSLIAHNVELIGSDSAIQCILLKSNEKARGIAAELQNKGLDVRAILSPTVPQGLERVRICLHTYNTTEEITLLTNTINQYNHE
jgi:8-amino-7-oxononanoate synthase